MQNLTLDLESLNVETFVTTEDESGSLESERTPVSVESNCGTLPCCC